MSRFLSETNINIIEHYIQKNKPIEILPDISECYKEQAIEEWKTINDTKTLPTTYLHFANRAYRMTSYGFYKTQDGQIFLVETFCGELSAYYKVVPNWNILIPYNILYQLNFNISETEPNTPDTEPNTESIN